MDTPEGDVFAIQSGAMEPLPLYVEQETELSGVEAIIAVLPLSSYWHALDQNTVKAFIESQAQVETGPKKTGAPEPIMKYPGIPYQAPTDELMPVRQAIVAGFFDSISRGREETVALFINNNLVTANTTNAKGKTPLLAAVATKNVRMVQQLLDFGADPNAFGVEVFTRPAYLLLS
jgi:ankyrin repeat protein